MNVKRQTEPSAVDVFDRVLDRGIVIDYSSRIFLLGIDILTTVEGRFVVASLSTYQKYGEALKRAGVIGPMVFRTGSPWASAITKTARRI